MFSNLHPHRKPSGVSRRRCRVDHTLRKGKGRPSLLSLCTGVSVTPFCSTEDLLSQPSAHGCTTAGLRIIHPSNDAHGSGFLDDPWDLWRHEGWQEKDAERFEERTLTSGFLIERVNPLILRELRHEGRHGG